MAFRSTAKRTWIRQGAGQHLASRPVSASDQASTLEHQKVESLEENVRLTKVTAPVQENSVVRQKLEPVPQTQPAAEQAAETPAAPEPEVRESAIRRFLRSVDWPRARIRFVFSIFAVCFAVLWGRAWYLQMIDGPRLAEKARRQHVTSELVAGRRGNIMDRDGQVLARSVEALSVYANPGEVEDLETTANTLGPILGMSTQSVYTKLARSGRKFVWLRRKIDDYTAGAVRMAGLPGIGLSREYDRVYPFKHMAGQLLGFVGDEEKGLEGLERALDDRLSCEPTRTIVQRDATGRRFYLHRDGEEDPHGEDITLTIDAQMQFFAEDVMSRVVREQKASWGGALIVDVSTGEILALAQYPFFNPNSYRSATASVYRNHLAQDAFEPGSTFKPLVLAAAMQERKVSRDTAINCENGYWKSKYTALRDTSSRGTIPVHQVIRYSSNIGMAKIGLMLGSGSMYNYLHELGFGERTTVPVAESKGILRNPKHWSEVDTMSISFGQGVSVTGLQMAQAYLTLLNNGVKKNLVLVKGMNEEAEKKQVYSRSVTNEIRRMLREVVAEKDGTGRRAAIEGVSVAGKTGTAQKADRRSGGYGQKRLASFVGFLPADNPRYLILVFLDEPQNEKFGGVIAAPAFKEIAQRTLAYAGELDGGKKGQAQTAVAAGTESRGRGLKVAGLASPFEKKPAAAPQVASVKRAAESPAEALRLPGHLAKASATVPDVQGKTLRNAVELFARAGIMPELKGSGMRVVKQNPPPGTPWPQERVQDEDNVEYVLWLSEL